MLQDIAPVHAPGVDLSAHHCFQPSRLLTVLSWQPGWALTLHVQTHRGGQRVSTFCWLFCGVFALLVLAYAGAWAVGAEGFSALGFLYLLSYGKLATTLIKCGPFACCAPAAQCRACIHHTRPRSAAWTPLRLLLSMQR